MQRADPSGCHGLESGRRVIGVRTVWGGADGKGLDNTVPRQLPTLLQNRHIEKPLIKEKKGANVELKSAYLLDEGAMLECESAPDLVCKVLKSERDGTEGVASAIKG